MDASSKPPPQRPLTAEEEQVIVYKGTEPPFTGEYDDFFKPGEYVCRRCHAPLYRSQNKFHSGCGWPSFDDEIPKAVRHETDADGMRTEILCAACGGHLGHVFEGERLTAKNVRHCVNSVSLKFVPYAQKEKEEIVYFGGGCFWCVEAAVEMVDGVVSVRSGYAGGSLKNPTYQQVCGGQTGHAEVVKVVFDPMRVSYSNLLKIFFFSHDPTTLNRQGNDVGTQYRSVILTTSDAQKKATEEFISQLQKEIGLEPPNPKIVTAVEPIDTFYEAEKEHQEYYRRNLGQGYCQAVIAPKLKKLKEVLKKGFA
jgi:peptide methionine sulfoxide reductase msrA/msrB